MTIVAFGDKDASWLGEIGPQRTQRTLFVLVMALLFVLPLLKLTFHALDGEPATGDATTFLLCAA